MNSHHWESGATYAVAIGNILLGALLWVEGSIIPHFMVWGGAALLIYNWYIAFKRKDKE